MNTPLPNPATLNGGQLFTAGVRLLQGNFLVLAGLSFLMYLALWAFTGVLTIVFGIDTFFIDFLAGPIISGVLLLVVDDVLADRPITLRAHFGLVVVSLGPVVVLSVAAQVLTGLAMIAFILPGLYVAAGLFILLPIVLIERAGWDSWGRTWALSKPYIWPIVGVLIRYFLTLAAIVFPLFMFGYNYFVPDESGQLEPLPILAQGVAIFVSAAVSVLGIALSLLVYYRLRDLHGSVSSVFE